MSQSRNRFDLSVYVLLDREFAAGRPLVEVAAAAVRGGATMLQLRDKGDDTRRFYTDAIAVVAWARAAGVPVIVNDRVDIALAVDADGVHVGEDDLPLFVTRRLMGAGKIIGASAGSYPRRGGSGGDGRRLSRRRPGV